MNTLAKIAVLAALAGLHGGAATAAEVPADRCRAPEELISVDVAMANVAAALRADQTLRVVVIGTASSAGAGVSQPAKAYPVQLETALRDRFPSARVAVLNRSKPDQTAAQMASRFGREVIAEKPSLLIWQTGTVEAVRGIDTDEFGAALETGIEELRNHHIDVVLMDLQFSPHTTPLINVSAYLEHMEQLAQANRVPLFRRYEIMRYWDEAKIFDLDTASKDEQRRNADLVHACIARLLAAMIERAVRGADARPSKP